MYARLCGKCGIAQFCGGKVRDFPSFCAEVDPLLPTQCQKEAWRHQQYPPHKVLCAKLSNLQSQLGLKDWAPTMKTWESGIGGELDILWKEKGIDAGQAQEIADVLQAVREPIILGTAHN